MMKLGHKCTVHRLNFSSNTNTCAVTKILGSQFLGNVEPLLHLCCRVRHDVGVRVCTGAVHVSEAVYHKDDQ